GDGGRGSVPSRSALSDAARLEGGDTGIAAWLEETLAEDPESRAASEFRPEYGDAVAADRSRLLAVRDLLSALTPETDPKLRILRELLEEVPPEKVAVFATYGETIKYLDENLPELVGGRERVVVVGSESSPDDRSAKLARFAPETVIRPGYAPPDGEVDLLLSTDVLSEGQNLQQA